jgi:hypothetical protein
MKRKRAIAVIAILIALIATVVVVVIDKGSTERSTTTTQSAARDQSKPVAPRTGTPGDPATPAGEQPSPGQGRALVEPIDAPGGVIAGRVINWSTGDGVGGAELSFDGPTGVVTVRSAADGAFALEPAEPGRFLLATATAPGFLPYAPEWMHSSIAIEARAKQRVRGVTVFLFPALDYVGRVVDAGGAPVAGASVRILGSPAGEQTIEKLTTEWKTSADGTFTFHAPDFTVFEAEHAGRRGRASLDGTVMNTKKMTIALGDLPAGDRAIAGRVVDENSAPVPDALVRAEPAKGQREGIHHAAFATTNDDGKFALNGLDAIAYRVVAQGDDHAPAIAENVAAGKRELVLVVDGRKAITGTVVNTDERPVPSYTLLAFRRDGVASDLIVARSIVDPAGRFRIPIGDGSYELVANAGSWAPSKPTPAKSGDRDVRIVVSAGATLKGIVVSAADGKPLQWARVMREAIFAGASAQPSNAGTVTRADGSFELTGLPPGPISITVAYGEFHPKIEAGITATDGAVIGPITIALTPLKPGEEPKLELVGIGVRFSADGDTLRVDAVIDGGGAQLAGIVAGDKVVRVDGTPVTELGIDGAVARIRGIAGTTVRIALARGPELVVERRPLKA